MTRRAEGPPPDARVDRLEVSAFTIPTDGPDGVEADGTLTWDSTTIVVVEVGAGGVRGLGYTYGDVAVARLIDSQLREVVVGGGAFEVPASWAAQVRALRNAGRRDAGAMAVSAVDIALWDLHARLVGLPLYRLLGAFHQAIPIYGSGGFCNYPLTRLAQQAAAWAEAGIRRVKVKTSRHPGEDPERLSACRAAVGDEVTLMADANGALTRQPALAWARRLHEEWGVDWFEEPVSSEDREGLRLVRDRGPAGLEVAAGEYGSVARDFLDLVAAGAVDCLQADVTRCGGITGLRQVAALAAAHGLDLSAHCAPAASTHAFCGVQRARHLEYFHDHVRVEGLLFAGAPTPEGGLLRPAPDRPGLGLELKRRDGEPYLVYRSGP